MNRNLNKARVNKNDEFYTRREDIEKEVKHYLHLLKGKVVYCNCDNPKESEFYKFFKDHFFEIGIIELIATHLETELCPASLTRFDGFIENVVTLKGGGSFISEECLSVLTECDVVVTNPPFSLFREFVDVMIVNDKDFLILGNLNAVTYKNVFPLIKDGKIRCGVNNGTITYDTPDGEKKLGNTIWFTTLLHNTLPPFLHLTKNYCEHSYLVYDNYNALEVNKVKDIPKNYYGIMGVPITFLSKHNPDQFEILGSRRWAKGKELEDIYIGGKSSVHEDLKTLLNGREVYDRVFIRRK